MDGPERYFQNTLGGLTQYYFGPLRDLGVLGHVEGTGDIAYTKERGGPIADAFDRGVDGKKFFAVLESDHIDTRDLDGLAMFCPCALPSNRPEQQALLDLLFDRSGLLGDAARARRASLGLVLDLAGRHRKDSDYWLADEFRASAYALTREDGTPWAPPGEMAQVLGGWRVYQQHELFAVAVQTIFWLVLDTALSERRPVARDARELVQRFFDSDVARRQARDLRAPLVTSLRSVRQSLPPSGAWTDPKHEVQCGFHVLEIFREDPAGALLLASQLLLALLARDDGADPYRGWQFEPGYLEDRYPLNLRAFTARARQAIESRQSVADLLTDIGVWTIDTHFHVAMQKLGESVTRDTFKVWPSEDTVRVLEAPEPGNTGPRVGNAIRFLYDLALLEDHDGAPHVSDLGSLILREIHG